MFHRTIGRAGAMAAAAVLLLSATTFADSVAADGDLVTADVQILVDLGTVAPGATIHRDVNLTLFCAGLRHVDPGQIVTVDQVEATVPDQGGSISATSTTIGPVPAEWANDTAGISGCAGPMHVDGDGPSHVTIVAPTVPGTGYAFLVTYGRSLAPAGVADASSTTGFTIVTFTLAVGDPEADASPPVFTAAPPDLELTTADPGGALVDFALPAATDDRDTQPAVRCDPASGSTFPVGVTTVTCTATDASGNVATASFTVTVHLATLSWSDPLHTTDLVMARGRSLPIKVQAWLDGTTLAGNGSLVVTDCGTAGVPQATLPMTRQNGRWMAVLDTSMLSLGCHRVALVANGLVLGSFGLELPAPQKASNALDRGPRRPT